MTPKDRLAAIAKRVEAATKYLAAPWQEAEDAPRRIVTVGLLDPEYPKHGRGIVAEHVSPGCMDLLVNAPVDVPWLLAEVTRMREALQAIAIAKRCDGALLADVAGLTLELDDLGEMREMLRVNLGTPLGGAYDRRGGE